MYAYRSSARNSDHIRRRPARRRRPAGLSPTGILRGVALGLIALLVMVGWPMQIQQTMLLGSAVMLWIVGNFAIEGPDGEA
jgi:predicted tellurium resistance membrane protein TerC